MDVVPPHTPLSAAGPSSEQEAVKEAPPVENTDPEDKTTPAKTHKDLSKSKAKQPAAAKQAKNGVSMAIAATVIIVLGLATLATYAFLKTQN
jgi:uncharacterized protein HemX